MGQNPDVPRHREDRSEGTAWRAHIKSSQHAAIEPLKQGGRRRKQADAAGTSARPMSWYFRLGAWIGIGTSPGALATGANIGSITTGSRTLIAVIGGACALSALAVATGLKARKHKAPAVTLAAVALGDRKSTRLNSSHVAISYAVFCLKK